MICARPLVLAAAAIGALTGIARAGAPAGPDIAAIQKLLAERRLDGWLLYDFRGSNAIAQEIVRPAGHQSRRWFYLVPQKGDPVAVVARIEAATFAAVPGKKLPFSSWRELEAALWTALKGGRRVAMEYFPKGQLATVSRVDAGTVELVRSMGAQVVSSADLVQAVKSRWGADGRESHAQAARAIERVKDEAWAFVARRLREGRAVDEWDVATRLRKALDQRGFDGGGIVAIGPNAADPHYNVTQKAASPIKIGDLLLLDITAKGRGPGAICADQTWMAFMGDAVPERAAKLFAVVRDARDAAVKFVREAHAKKKTIRGFEVDDVARGVVTRAGFGSNFIHRTGHSIDTRCHGDGVNMDDFETRDERTIIPGLGFSIEPGIYLPGEIGVRSEIDVFYGEDGVEVTTQGVQDEIPALLAGARIVPVLKDGAPQGFKVITPAPTTKALLPKDRPAGDFGPPLREEYLDKLEQPRPDGELVDSIQAPKPDKSEKPKK